MKREISALDDVLTWPSFVPRNRLDLQQTFTIHIDPFVVENAGSPHDFLHVDIQKKTLGSQNGFGSMMSWENVRKLT